MTHSPPRLLRFALGPTMGQACGGIVWLAIGLAVFLANRSRRGRSVSVIPAD